MRNLLYILFFFPFVINAQHTFDKRYNENLKISFGEGLIETEDYYICYGSKGDFGQQDTMRPMFLVVDKQGDLVNNQNFDNGVCQFHINNYLQNNQREFIGIGSTRSPGDTCGLSPSGFPVRGRMYLHKLDEQGNVIWQKNYGDTLHNNKHRSGSDITYSDDGNYYIYGTTQGQVIYKINEFGDSLWSKHITALGANKKIKKVDGGYLIFGISGLNLSATMFNNNFDFLWSKSIGTKYEDLKTTKDKGFIVSSFSYTYPIFTTTLTKLDQEANILWTQDYFDTAHINPNTDNFRAGKCVTETSDGNYVTAYKDVIKVNKEGEILWKHRYIEDNFFYYYNDVIETQDGGFLLTGRTGWTLETILTKVDCNGNLEWSTESCLLPTEEEILVFPNPVQSQLTIQLPQINQNDNVDVYLYNMLGQKIKKISSQNEQIFTFKMSNLRNGVYFYSILVNNEKYKTGKIIKN